MAEIYRLPPKLDLPAAAPLAGELRDRLSSDLTLDASDVGQIGALCAQVIASAALAGAAAGHRLSLTNMSDKIVEQLGHLGLTPETLVETPE